MYKKCAVMRDYKQSKFISTQSLLRKAVNCSKHTFFEIITFKVKKQGRSQLYSLRPFTIALSAWMGGAFYTFGFVAYGTLIFAKRMQFANVVKLQLGNNE